MTTQTTTIDYAALGQTEQEAALLREHDKNETLHPFTAGMQDEADPSFACQECGDDESGLMHSNTWRNVEPLLDNMVPLTEAETTEYLAGRVLYPGAVETPEGVMIPVQENTYGSDEPDEQTLADAEDAQQRLAERSQRAYDPAFDTARVDEATVRRHVGIGVPLRLVGTVLAQGRFLPGGRGCYGAVYVMCEQANGRGYSTNQAIVRAEDGQPITVFAENGHYDMTREDAQADLATR